MPEGVITKALGGFYDVHGPDGVYCCKARGKFRQARLIPLVGDRVAFTALADAKGTMDDILPRRNQFVRPPVANIDAMVLFVSAVLPVTEDVYKRQELLVRTLQALETGTAPRTPQDEALATYAPMITKELAVIDWTKPAQSILCQIRGLLPWPVATAEFGGTVFKIFAAQQGQGCGEPGTVLECGKNGLEVACGDGSVVITQLQAPGGKRMFAADYFRGHPLSR